MSDAPQGPGWWQASDGKWYAPEQATGGQSMPGGAGAPMGGGAGSGELADFGARAIGLIIDVGIIIGVVIVGLILAAILGAIVDVLGLLVLIAVYIVAIVGSFYFAYLVGAKGQSPGMALMGLRAMSAETGQPVGGGMGIVRSIVTGIIPCYLGYLAFFMGEKRQTVGDMVAKSIVVSGQPKAQFGPELFKP